jgi:hypothetical protein
MGDVSRYSDMSNDEFFKILKSKEIDMSWTIGEVIEYQRRGSHAFDYDLKLVATLNRFIEKQNEKYAEILKPIQESMSKMVSLTISDSTKRFLDSITSQNNKIASLLPKFDAQSVSFPKFDLKDILKIEPTIIDTPLASSRAQKVIVEGFQEVANAQIGHLAEIAANTRWDWKQWTLFALAAIGAITGILGLFT